MEIIDVIASALSTLAVRCIDCRLLYLCQFLLLGPEIEVVFVLFMCVQTGEIPDDGVGSCMLKGTVSDCCK